MESAGRLLEKVPAVVLAATGAVDEEGRQYTLTPETGNYTLHKPTLAHLSDYERRTIRAALEDREDLDAHRAEFHPSSKTVTKSWQKVTFDEGRDRVRAAAYSSARGGAVLRDDTYCSVSIESVDPPVDILPR